MDSQRRTQVMEPSDLAACYRTLGLTNEATEQDIKSAYRQLARQYHPDVNPGDPTAEAHFKQVALAYQALLTAFQQRSQGHPPSGTSPSVSTSPAPTTPSAGASVPTAASTEVRFHIHNPEQRTPTSHSPQTSQLENEWKRRQLNQLQRLLQRGKWQQAIELAEDLAYRFKDDPEVQQGQGLAYHGWGRKLLDRKRYEQARVYLKKALQADPRNQKLWSEVERDYRRIERQLRL
ncbi:DnaJ domain-containing protein [Leptolyngbya sp. FACHB-261]|uniref:J domain-containing protein n=1 Tax=Leptolyngbya sp. FACHB-261 TaxID=2692806 RepID=UPI001686C645|nr:DnaJ domain-containing protein [Leptolyngbya sp. FACHB-261]MBD2100321.1 DnaJ domain-containing protein [Leptolyngbya sp. FACHB-261]